MEDMDKIKGRSPRKKTCPRCDMNTLNMEMQTGFIYPCHHCGYVMSQREIYPPRTYDGIEYEPGSSEPYKERSLEIKSLPSREKIKEMMEK